jgi:hypothetical protein
MAPLIRRPRTAAGAPACGHEALIEALQEQVLALEGERDAARAGMTMMERALRRSGCCDRH